MTNNPSHKRYRYPGATPFSVAQSQLFFGRDEALDALQRSIRRHPTTVLYGKSGLGKSSLVNAGLIPAVANSNSYGPVYIRFSSALVQDAETPLSRLKKLFSVVAPNPTPVRELLAEDQSLWSLAKQAHASLEKPPLVIFDQFEEIFNYPWADIEALLEELSELTQKRIPLRIRRRIDLMEELDEDLEDLLDRPLMLKLLFVIRSDKLHLLNKFNAYFPEILKYSVELVALTIPEATAAITLPASLMGDFESPIFSFQDAALRSLLDFLKDPHTGLVEGILLQMVCEYYERNVVMAEGVQEIESISSSFLKELIQNYYWEKIEEVPEGQQEAAVKLVEEGLLSESEGIRLSLHEAYINQKFGVSQQTLSLLVENRLLRTEAFERGGATYELAHDRLIPAVLKSRAERRKKELQEELILANKAKSESQRRNQRLLLLVGIIVISNVLTLAGLFYAYSQQKIANQAKLKAEAATLAAMEAQAETSNALLKVDSARILAEKNAKIAKQAQIEAELNLQKARAEQGQRESLEFVKLYGRAEAALQGGFTPEKDWINKMEEISNRNPQNALFRRQLNDLLKRIVELESD